MILSYSFGACVYIYIMWMIFYWWNYMLTCRGVSSPNGAKDAKLQACGWSMLVIKCAPNCASCWGSLLLIISISPPSYNFSTHWEATESDVMPFKLPSKPRSCSKRHQDAKFKWLKTISMNIILWTLLYIYKTRITTYYKSVILTSKKETEVSPKAKGEDTKKRVR